MNYRVVQVCCEDLLQGKVVVTQRRVELQGRLWKISKDLVRGGGGGQKTRTSLSSPPWASRRRDYRKF